MKKSRSKVTYNQALQRTALPVTLLAGQAARQAPAAKRQR